ncbi:MAG: M60 family metallopeptidase [Planctomycetota bacterium]
MLTALALLIAWPQQPLDLAADTGRQVVVDREPGQYLGHVSTVLLRDGRTILAAYPEGHGKGAIVLKRSADGGRSWSERLPVPTSWATSQEVPTLWRTTDANGRERLLLWSGLHPARLAHSDDDGATWSELEPAGDWGGIVVMGDVAATGTPGRWIAFFHDDGRFLRAGGAATGTFTLLQTESQDGGLSWSAPRELWSGGELHLCEPGAVRSPDGAELTLLLRENARRAPSHRMASRDDGATWSAPAPLHPALTGDRHTLRYAPDGRLVAVFRDTMLGEHATKGDFVAWVGRYDDLAAGRPGQYRVRLLDNQDAWDCGYPGLEVLADGTFVATTYGHWDRGESPYIRSVRFTLDELDRLAGADPQLAPAASSGLAAAADDDDALELLLSYRPTAQRPEDPEVLAAERRLFAAMPKIVASGGALAQRLSALHAARRAELVPSRERPIRARDPLARVLVRFDDERTATLAPEFVLAHPAAAGFPGAVGPDAVRVPAGMHVELATPGRRSLGLYAPPGAQVQVRFGDGRSAPPPGLRLRIGAHSDDIRRRDRWPRMPRISRVFAVDRGELTIANAYGGLLYLEIDTPSDGGVDVRFDQVVAAPLFELGRTALDDWQRQLQRAPAPWAELATDKVVLTVPSAAIRGLGDPRPLLEFWDTLLDAASDLAAQPRPRLRPERYVADLEISAGAMHAGYPIMTHLDAVPRMVELDRLRGGAWGLFHELGHNHQSRDWTFRGTGEVTVNLFSLYLCDTLCGVPWDQAWNGNLARAQQRLAEHVRAGTSPWGDDRPGQKPDLALRLLMYSQIQREFGWEAFSHLFAEYRELPAEQRPATDADKRDQWLVRLSRGIDRDLGPFFAAWGLPVSDAARREVQDLEDWMPADWPRR